MKNVLPGVGSVSTLLFRARGQQAAGTARDFGKKRGGFVGSGPSKPPFAPMRGVGEGEKIYKLY